MKKLRSLVIHLNIIGFIPALLIYLFITSCSEKKAPEPTLENSDYTGVSRIVILSNSISTSSISGFSEVSTSCTFSVRAQSKDGILLMKMDLVDYNNKVISSSSDNSSSGLTTSNQQNFSNINITDYTGTYFVYIPSDTKDSVIARATLIDKLEHEEFAYFTIYLKRPPFNIYFNESSVPDDSIKSNNVNAGSAKNFYLMAKSDVEPINITYLCYKKSTKVSLDGFPKKSTFSNSSFNSSSNGYYSNYFSITTPDTGIYILKAYSYTQYGSADTTEIILYSQPPVSYSNTSSLGAQYNTLLGISYLLGSYSSYYKYLTQTSRSTFSYVYDNSTPYLISLFERKDANIYGDSLPINTQHTRFIELSLPISSYDTISENYIFNMVLPAIAPEKISISTSKLIAFEDSDQNKGVVKINSIVVGSTGSVNFSNRYQYKLATE